MKPLVIGQGGREHALARALRLSPSVKEVHALPGSDGIAEFARCHAVDWKNFDAVAEVVRENAIDFVVIGPEVPLVGGLSDALRAKGIRVVGPSREAAQLEGSKIYSKVFLDECRVRTARYETVSTVEQTKAAAKKFAAPFVLKADGLAAGKGVFICKTLDELVASAKSIFEVRSLGDAGLKAVLEEFQPGYEISYLILTDGENFEPLVLAQDHKRLNDGDEGPNTGGMGVVAPVAIDANLRGRIDREVVRPVVAHLKKRGLLYRGVLYIGLMITEDGPSVLEFNTRFGDPEAQVILPLLDGDWAAVFGDLADGKLRQLEWKSGASCCVVLAAEGYPDSPVNGAPISGGLGSANETRYFLHAGTKKDSQKGWVTAGGRVLNAIGLGKDLKEAVSRAYAQANEARWTGLQMRKDIGAKVL
jgi:phosphoribosylamine--glycine ligase